MTLETWEAYTMQETKHFSSNASIIVVSSCGHSDWLVFCQEFSLRKWTMDRRSCTLENMVKKTGFLDYKLGFVVWISDFFRGFVHALMWFAKNAKLQLSCRKLVWQTLRCDCQWFKSICKFVKFFITCKFIADIGIDQTRLMRFSSDLLQQIPPFLERYPHFP